MERSLPGGIRRCAVALVGLALVLPLGGTEANASGGGGKDPGAYRNPLTPDVDGGTSVDSCADPTVLRGQQRGDDYWYLYCTTDPLNDTDLDVDGNLIFHRIPMMRSLDLVDWEYVADAFDSVPEWAAPTAALWAPEVVYSTTFEQYYLFFVVTDSAQDAACGNDSAIGVATADGPLGPWTFASEPVVAPRRDAVINPDDPCGSYLWTFDPDVLGDAVGATSTLYYGSYYGGIFGATITLDSAGATVDAASTTQVTIGNRYEGANVVFRRGYYYLFVSATNCCNGALTGYSVFVGRSTDPLGPFVDREGVTLLAAEVGGTPFLSMNGNRWVGTGHNTVFRDAAGDWWTIYHAVDRFDPYFATAVGFTKRPALLDAVDWVDGWPSVNGGRWASDRKQPAPAGQPGYASRHETDLVDRQVTGRPYVRLSDSFSGGTLDSSWSWVREPAPETFEVDGGILRFDVQKADLYVDSNTASVLTRAAPAGDYVVQTRVHMDVPAEGNAFNYAQGGLVIYGDDDNFIKLTEASIWETRQTEFAKELSPVPEGWSRYGNTVIGPPGERTTLRIVVERLTGRDRSAAGGDTERYTAYTRRDGQDWVRGGAWTHSLGSQARIGLVSMGQQADVAAAFTSEFDYVRVYRLRTPHEN